jgi:hypothetical protein
MNGIKRERESGVEMTRRRKSRKAALKHTIIQISDVHGKHKTANAEGKVNFHFLIPPPASSLATLSLLITIYVVQFKMS